MRNDKTMNELKITEYNNIRVLTTQQIAEVYGTNADVISRNFSNNKERYTEGKHYICLTGDELREAKANGKIYGLQQNANKFYLWTEKGAFLHAKSLGTDKAWEVYENLVDFYFNKKKPLSALEQINLTQQAVLEVNEKIDNVKDELEQFKQDMPVLGCDIDRIQYTKNKKVVPLLGGKDSEAYNDKSIRSRVYSDISVEIRRQFQVPNQKCLKRNRVEQAIEVIDNYVLPIALKEEIDSVNSQMSFC